MKAEYETVRKKRIIVRRNVGGEREESERKNIVKVYDILERKCLYEI